MTSPAIIFVVLLINNIFWAWFAWRMNDRWYARAMTVLAAWDESDERWQRIAIACYEKGREKGRADAIKAPTEES